MLNRIFIFKLMNLTPRLLSALRQSMLGYISDSRNAGHFTT
jgi:hypothetical protein